MSGGCQSLRSLSSASVRALLSSVDTILTDCDGVLWVGKKAIEGSVEFVNAMRASGKKVFLVTNNSTKARNDYVEKCLNLGFDDVKEEEIVSPSYLAAEYLKHRGFRGKVYVVGSPGILKELDKCGIRHSDLNDRMIEGWTLEHPEALLTHVDPEYNCVIAGFDPDINYKKIAMASTILGRKDSTFIATNTDEQFPIGNGIILPGTGSIVSAVATASDRHPIVMGKPSEVMFAEVRAVHPEIDPRRTLMIGDRANTDILLGKRCGLKTLMVGSGVHSLDDIRRWEASPLEDEKVLAADYYVDKLGDVLEIMEKPE